MARKVNKGTPKEGKPKTGEAPAASEKLPSPKGPKVVVDTCAGNRPTSKEGEQPVKESPIKYEELPADMFVSVHLYAGCIQGDRLSITTQGEDRNVFLSGTVESVVMYAVGEEVTVESVLMSEVGKGFTVENKRYRRNVARKQDEAVGRLRQEMTGKGELIEEAIKKTGPDAYHDGYTITVNGTQVTGDSKLNSFLKPCTYVLKQEEKKGRKTGEKKPVIVLKEEVDKQGLELFLKDGKPIEFIGGVDITVAAIIKPGDDYSSASGSNPGRRYRRLDERI